MRLAFSVSAFDATDGDDDLSFVISLLDNFQEEDTICFGLTNEIGLVSQVTVLLIGSSSVQFLPTLFRDPNLVIEE